MAVAGSKCRIVEVFPRDGLQTMLYEQGWRLPSTDEKVQIIEALVDCGIRSVEVTGFVHPRVIPALADAEEVVRRLGKRVGVTYSAVVPNLKGAQRAVAAGIGKVACTLVLSDSYQQLNANMTTEETAQQVEKILLLCKESSVPVEISMSMGFQCPYEGIIPEERVLGMIDRFVRQGVEEFDISDPLGMADPDYIGSRVERILTEWPHLELGLHLHDAAGMALASIYAAWQAGVRSFDTSLCGLGGGIAMPYSIGEMGNVPTEDVVNMFQRMGIETGIDMQRLLETARMTESILGRPGRSRVTRHGTLEQVIAKGKEHMAKGRIAPGDSKTGSADWMRD